ncbi:MAG: hypothetical protein L3K18_04480 [Thermoplasmata archaeon]|nr:hypothetical protein [Thermoplasmata archaeon]MCI4356382.1 hypothetical protein [Thermoplasmata archaeon]
MCADSFTTLSPELALLVQRLPASRHDAIALSVLRDELEGGHFEWEAEDLARSGSHPIVLARHRWAGWTRFFHGRGPAPGACPVPIPT